MKQIEVLQEEQNNNPEYVRKAFDEMVRLSSMDIQSIYEDLSKEERRRFWRGIIRSINVTKDRKINVEFLAIPSCNK